MESTSRVRETSGNVFFVHTSNPGEYSSSSGTELDWALRAVALARRTGAPLLACLAGIRTPPSAVPGAGLGFASAPAPQNIGDLETAMLADFALGGALRARIARGRPLPTLTLGLDIVRAPRSAAGFTARATPTAIEDGLGTATARLWDGDAAIGHAWATFAVPSRGRHPVLPWDAPDPPAPPPIAPSDLDGAEAVALSCALDPIAGDGGPPLSWGDRVIAGRATAAVRDGLATVRLRPTAALANRAGAVQGAALVALATRSARVAATGNPTPDGTGTAPRGPGHDGSPAVRSVAIRFASAADTGTELQALARVEHRTRRTVFVDVRIVQAGATRAAGGVVCRVPRT